MPEESKDLVRRFVGILNSGRWDDLDQVVPPDYVQHNPMVSSGLEGLKQFLEGFGQALPDASATVQGLFAEADRVAAMTAVTGTQEGDLFGMPASGKRVTVRLIDVWRVAHGKLAEHWDVVDLMGLMRQLGMGPGPEPAEDAEVRSAVSVIPGADGKTDENKAATRRFCDAVWSGGDLAAAREFLDDDLTDHDPVEFPGRQAGAAGLLQVIGMVRAAFPDLRRTVEDQVAEGDIVLTRFTDEAHTGPFMEIPPTGRPVKVAGINVERHVGGKIAGIWHIEDFAGMMQQLGVA